MFGIEDSLCNFRKRVFTVRCMSESSKLWHISKNVFAIYIYIYIYRNTGNISTEIKPL